MSLEKPCKLSSATEIICSLVAVCGLGGHPIRSWTSEDIIWFRDYLPNLVPDCNLRVLSFGYNSRLYAEASTFRPRDFAT